MTGAHGRSKTLLALIVAGVLLAYGGCGKTSIGMSDLGNPAPSPNPNPTPLPVSLAWVSALSIGQWYAIPNTPLSSVEPNPVPPGNGPDSKVVAWTSFVVDTRNSKVYSVANGGHNDYAGNEVDVLNLELDQPTWTQVLAPTPTNQLTNCQSYYADGRPASRHTYYGVTLDIPDDRIMLFAGAPWCVNGGFHSAISSYNITANSYNPASLHGTMGSTFSDFGAYSVDPSNGNVYVFLGSNYGVWTRSTNTFTVLNPSGSSQPDGHETMSAMDTTRNRILLAGGDSGAHHLYVPSTNAFTSVTFTGAQAGVAPAASQAGMVYVAAIDRFLFRQGAAGGAVYQIDPATFEVTTFATTGGASVPATAQVYNKFLYVPRLGGIVYVPEYAGNVWFLKVHN